MKNKDINKEALEFILPQDSLVWFDIVKAEKTETQLIIILEEKNDPPLPDNYNGEKITSKGFHDIAINDFPDYFISVVKTIKYHENEILNYFINRSTNAGAESFNSKLKGFRAVVRGVRDKKYFLF